MALRFAAGTRAYLATVAPAPRRRIRDALRLLERDPRHSDLDVKQLQATGPTAFYRALVGDYRIVYTPQPKQTYVWRIMHRSEGYAWMERLDSP